MRGSEGGVDTLQIEVNAENYKVLLSLLKDAIIENARGYDAKDDRMSGNPNQMNIQSMYSDIDLDANGIEMEFQASMEELLWFVNQHLANTRQQTGLSARQHLPDTENLTQRSIIRYIPRRKRYRTCRYREAGGSRTPGVLQRLYTTTARREYTGALMP